MLDWLFQTIGAVAGAGAVYAAIRADLATLHERTSNAQHTARKAHDRIDAITMHARNR